MVDYFRRPCPPRGSRSAAALHQTRRPSFFSWLPIHQVQLSGLRDDLASAAPLVPCTDEQLYPAREVHFPSRDICDAGTRTPVAVTTGVAPAVLDWLGVQKAPSDRCPCRSGPTACPRRPRIRTPAVAEAVLRTLQARDGDLPESRQSS